MIDHIEKQDWHTVQRFTNCPVGVTEHGLKAMNKKVSRVIGIAEGLA